MDRQSTTLPPLPPSDPLSLQWNRKDHFYEVGAREFWSNNEVVREEVRPFQNCNHYFMKKETEIICQKCHFGLSGNGLEIRDGKLFSGGEPLGF